MTYDQLIDQRLDRMDVQNEALRAAHGIDGARWDHAQVFMTLSAL